MTAVAEAAAEAATDQVTLAIKNHVATVVIDRQHVLNAVDAAAQARLNEIWEQLEADASVRAVVITGAGPRAFCVGADMSASAVDKTGLEYWAGLDPNGFGGLSLRTTLDVLNQELELRSAEVNLVTARRNHYVAQAALLAAMGRLEGADLMPSLDVYDPADNFQRVRNRGGLPWDGVVEAIDRIAAPSIMPANDQVDAPIDQQLKSEIVRTAPSE